MFLLVESAATAENGFAPNKTENPAMENLPPTPQPVDWETCPLHNLLHRILRLNRALPFCRGRAADAYESCQRERDRLIEIYSRRVKESK
jgi:hypothetical protein